MTSNDFYRLAEGGKTKVRQALSWERMRHSIGDTLLT